MIVYLKSSCKSTGQYIEIELKERDDLSLGKNNKNEPDESKYGLLLKIVGVLFNDVQEKLDKDIRDSYSKNREIINYFEKVVSCIRIANMEIREILKQDKDNLSVLMNIGNALNLKQEVILLLNSYLELMQFNEMKFDIELKELPKEIQDIFTEGGEINAIENN